MSRDKTKYYEVYREAEKIGLEEITWEGEDTGSPSLKVTVAIDGCIIENVTFRRDIASRAYATPPEACGHQAPAATILFGGQVQEILDSFADYILPSMKPLGINPLTGEKVLDIQDRTDSLEINDSKRRIGEHQFVWQRQLTLNGT